MSDAVRPAIMCPKCSAAVAPDNLFCGRCGAAVTARDHEPALDIAREFARGTVAEAGNHLREALKSKTTHKIAAGAVLGAAVASAIPFVTAGVGAAVGAGVIAYRRLLK